MNGHIYGMIARDRLGRPDASVLSLEVLDMERDGIVGTRVVVADVPPLKSGPNKGKPNYKASVDRQPLIVLPGESEAWLAEHPEICPECANNREVFVRWSIDDGTTMRPCPVCVEVAP